MARATDDNKKKKNLQLKLAIYKYYKLITFVLVILLAAGSYYFILEPKYQEVGVGGKYNLDTLKMELAKRESYLASLKKLNENYQKVSQTDLDKLNKILPEEKDIPGLFNQMQNIAEANNLVLSSISFSEATETNKNKKSESKIKKVSISLNLVGRRGYLQESERFFDDLRK